MENTSIVHPAYWRAVSDLGYALLCMTAFCSNVQMREEINSLRQCVNSIHKAYGLLKGDSPANGVVGSEYGEEGHEPDAKSAYKG